MEELLSFNQLSKEEQQKYFEESTLCCSIPSCQSSLVTIKWLENKKLVIMTPFSQTQLVALSSLLKGIANELLNIQNEEN